MTNSHPITRLQKFRLLSLIPLYFMIVGLFLQPITEILPGLWTLIKEPDFLITDYFLVGGIGTSFINAGLLTLLCIWTIYFLDMEMDGHTITSSCLMFGFSLFGKNLLNIWAILFGVYLYSHYHKTHLSRYVYIGFYGCKYLTVAADFKGRALQRHLGFLVVLVNLDTRSRCVLKGQLDVLAVVPCEGLNVRTIGSVTLRRGDFVTFV